MHRAQHLSLVCYEDVMTGTWQSKEFPAARLGDSQPCEFLVLATQELFAGKLKAMIDRQHPRDLYDLFRFTKSNLFKDSKTLRRLAVLFGSTMDRDFRTYTLDRVLKVDAKQIDNLLYPLLKADDRPTAAEMLAATRPLIESVLDHDRDAAYLAAMGEGKYLPELLFPKQPEIVERIRRHPALLWKADNVARYLMKSKRP